MSFFSSWYFIGIMAFLLVALVVATPLVVILVVVMLSKNKKTDVDE